jgi:hypothetical protein
MDVLVRLEASDGTRFSRLLRADSPSFVFCGQNSDRGWSAHFKLGIQRMLLGPEHLLFVFCLMFLARSGKHLAATVGAFTVAHSIALAVATVGGVRPSPALVEVGVALSVLYVAVQLAAQAGGNSPHTARRIWMVALGFGLLHGFSFAADLRGVGLSTQVVPVALLSFNLGLELGQMLVVMAVLLTVALMKRAPTKASSPLRQIPAYAVGSLAAAWLISRTLDIC